MQDVDYEQIGTPAERLKEKTSVTDAWRLEESKNKKLIPFCANCFNVAYNKGRHSTNREDYALMVLVGESEQFVSHNKYKEKTIEIYREFKCRMCRSGVSQSVTPEELSLLKGVK